ncbi:biliverdin-producing heme oxygenase [Variovorax sp. OV329]|uniref:biliverdin-producing heme oxygenase n=1 Tax=Variovorax sp. OV329 TaxID=1882825 RepID=UPI0008E4C6AA|nr:biliverdin-producing heme oxygenase [Variovorax sp. OV329]SFL95483.1 Heme oxygenase [Variovorax sp. OV329]
MPLSHASPSLADYRSHLVLLSLWLQDLAKLGVDRARLDAEAHAIDTDLRECGRLLGADSSAPPASAPPPDIKPSRCAAFGWGARYVLEGSRLGAGFLHRKLAGALAPHPLAYLSGAGWTREGAWRDFLSQLQRQVGTPADVADACEGANAAFALLLHRCQARTAAP